MSSRAPARTNPRFERGTPPQGERGKGTQALAFAGPAGTVLGTCPNDWVPILQASSYCGRRVIRIHQDPASARSRPPQRSKERL